MRISIRWPPAGDETSKAELVAAERSRARELADEGLIIRLWRIPGRWENVGIWRAANATELHEAISSLPLYPWFDVSVTALAAHPNDPGERQPGR